MGEARRRQEFMQQNGIQPMPKGGMKVKVDLSKATQRACACGCKLFDQKTTVYTISAIVSPTGQEFPVQVPVLICMECKAVLSIGKKDD